MELNKKGENVENFTHDTLKSCNDTWNVIEMDILGHHDDGVGGGGAGEDGLEIPGTWRENHLIKQLCYNFLFSKYIYHLMSLNLPLLEATNKADILEL